MTTTCTLGRLFFYITSLFTVNWQYFNVDLRSIAIDVPRTYLDETYANFKSTINHDGGTIWVQFDVESTWFRWGNGKLWSPQPWFFSTNSPWSLKLFMREFPSYFTSDKLPNLILQTNIQHKLRFRFHQSIVSRFFVQICIVNVLIDRSLTPKNTLSLQIWRVKAKSPLLWIESRIISKEYSRT